MRRWSVLAALLALFALAPLLGITAARAGDATQVQTEPQRVMVMLDLSPDHLRAGSSYGGDYSDTMGEKQRLLAARKIARDHHLTLIQTWPMELIGVNCVILQIDDGRSVEAVVGELEKVPEVAWSQPYNEFQMQGREPPPGSHPASYNDKLLPAQPAALRWHLASLHRVTTGKGMTIAIIDSRIDTQHPDLAGQVGPVQDFVPGRLLAERHGTGVAGIIAARPNNAMGIAGVAPGARILSLRACWEKTRGGATVCDSLSLARALTYAIENHADVINLSLSGPPDRLIATLIQSASQHGIVVVAAIDEGKAGVSFPAMLPGVIAVGDERLSDRSANAYIAPGLDVPTTEPEGKWNIVSGSSYAAAHVSGLVALLRQASGKHKTADALLGPHGSIDACAAMARVSRLEQNTCEARR